MGFKVVFEETDTFTVVNEFTHASAVAKLPNRGDTVVLNDLSYKVLNRIFHYKSKFHTTDIDKVVIEMVRED